MSFDEPAWAGGLRIPPRTGKELASGLPGLSKVQSGLASVSTGRHASGVLECEAPLDLARLGSRSHRETLGHTPGNSVLENQGETLDLQFFQLEEVPNKKDTGKLGHDDPDL